VPEDSDLDAWTAMLADPEVSRFLGPPLDTRGAVAAHLDRARERHAADGFGLLAAVRKADGRVIGRAGFLVWDTRTWAPTTLRDAGEHAQVEIGWTLARDCWGEGYATEAGAACRDHGFTQLRLAHVAALIMRGNDRSVAVARRLGMQHERDVRTANGFDSQVFGITRAAWEKLRRRAAGTARVPRSRPGSGTPSARS
jgi:RimJ/RimL family protein N-acetyltransferase